MRAAVFSFSSVWWKTQQLLQQSKNAVLSCPWPPRHPCLWALGCSTHHPRGKNGPHEGRGECIVPCSNIFKVQPGKQEHPLNV